MTNLTQIITQWIGEGWKDLNGNPAKPEYNEALKDIKSKIPDLIEQIEKEVEKDMIVKLLTKFGFSLHETKQLLKTLKK